MKGLSSGSLVLSFSGTETEIAGSFFTGKTLNEGCAQSRGKLLFSPFFLQINPIPQIPVSKGVHT